MASVDAAPAERIESGISFGPVAVPATNTHSMVVFAGLSSGSLCFTNFNESSSSLWLVKISAGSLFGLTPTESTTRSCSDSFNLPVAMSSYLKVRFPFSFSVILPTFLQSEHPFQQPARKTHRNLFQRRECQCNRALCLP